jgi:hypothetical protein
MNPLRYVGWAVLALWSARWSFFAVAGGVFQGGISMEVAVRVACVAALVIGIPLLAFRRPGVGAPVLIAEGLGLLAWVVSLQRNPPATTLFLVLTLALPPALAGVLLLADAWRSGASSAA